MSQNAGQHRFFEQGVVQPSPENRLSRLLDAGAGWLLRHGLVGLEKESLRVTAEGTISPKTHPRALGSPLTHPQITTDYSEALIELITPPLPGLELALEHLSDLHSFVAPRLDEEILWATSMPCVVARDSAIPIAQFGRSNEGLMKEIYRRGLGNRYGRVMQVISGVHLNFSVARGLWPILADIEGIEAATQAYATSRYFGLVRNVQRTGWLVPYLFGASPAVCRSFLGGREDGLQTFDRNTLYLPYATSLRMSDLGYQNKKGSKVALNFSYNGLDEYTAGLEWATSTEDPEYAALGVIVDGEYRQLNANVLQIENEYYASIRPKQIAGPGERPLLALRRRGVEYVELRSLDVSPLDTEGVNLTQIRFLEALLLHCWLMDSPPVGDDERDANRFNLGRTAMHGRDPDFRLVRGSRSVAVREWGLEICSAMQGICEVLDGDDANRPYTCSLNEQREAFLDPDRTPSARMLADMGRTGEGFYHYAMRLSQAHHDEFLGRSLTPERLGAMESMVERSWREHSDIEDRVQEPFDQFLASYFGQGREAT